jgi:hypothetical protein
MGRAVASGVVSSRGSMIEYHDPLTDPVMTQPVARCMANPQAQHRVADCILPRRGPARSCMGSQENACTAGL